VEQVGAGQLRRAGAGRARASGLRGRGAGVVGAPRGPGPAGTIGVYVGHRADGRARPRGPPGPGHRRRAALAEDGSRGVGHLGQAGQRSSPAHVARVSARRVASITCAGEAA
jgi:hypothetical protein